jgi:phosphatidate phosphatase PAH1
VNENYGICATHKNLPKMYNAVGNMADTQFVYISVRPFNRTEDTRLFINYHKLPPGPIITVPYQTVDSVHAFVGGLATKLKMIFVKELQMLGEKVAGGFGNRYTDYHFYVEAGVPLQVTTTALFVKCIEYFSACVWPDRIGRKETLSL